MLLIVMHDNDQYLHKIMKIIEVEKIKEVKLIENPGLGSSVTGGNKINVLNIGKMLPKYNKAVIAVIRDKNRLESIMTLLNDDEKLKKFNIDNSGFICTLPYNEIKELGITKTNSKELKILDYLKEDMIILDMKSSRKKEVIQELAEVLCRGNSIAGQSEFIAEVFKREELGSTGIGKGIAIPHARTDNVKEFAIVIGRSDKGIEFKSVDKQPVKLVFLMGTPASKEIKSYLYILAHLNRLLQKNEFRSKLLKAADAKEVISVFKRAEL